jgi:L-fucose isomerase-like protein
MWDWEIVSYLRLQMGLNVFTPYNIELAKVILRAISAKRQMKGGVNFLMFQDDPGEGMQAYIFKRFYWWEAECTGAIEKAFNIKIVYKSWKAVNERARQIADADAAGLWEKWAVPQEDVSEANILKAVKLYMAIKEVIDATGNVRGVGANCLNESFHSDTTPCLAWNWVFERDHIIWACEGDTVTLISKFILYSALRKPLMMTNIYPFLVGMAALKHEKIDTFPDIADPDNHALGVHCGYFGFAPQSFCTHWVMRPKALAIVNDNAIVIDCRMKTGPVTMAKLRSDMRGITIIEAEIEDYAQYPGSDCRNGALIRYRNRSGHKVMEALSSHHAILIQGDITHELLQMAKVYGFSAEVI